MKRGDEKMGAKLILRFKKNPLQIFQWNSLDAVIDQKMSIKVPWTQTVEYNIDEGHHNIQMSFSYMGADVGKAQKEFDIKEGQTLHITYKPPIIVYNPGAITVEKA